MFAPRLLPLGVLAAYSLLTVVVPLSRMKARSNTSGFVVHRAPEAIHRIVTAVGGLLVLGAVLLSSGFAWFGGGALGIWPLPVAARLLGLILLGVSLLVIMTAQRQMGASFRIGIDAGNTALVTVGLYGLVRNPIYTGMLLAIVGFTLLVPSAATVLAALLGAFLVAVQARLEENHLLSKHGGSYRSYASMVGRFWPGIGRLSLRV
jgi:protein-S-isoprenylcysteine O-methyltransferase Ste14